MLKTLLRNKTVFITIFVILLCLISWQSLIPKPINAFQHTSDKLLHFIAWFVLGVNLLLGLNTQYTLAACSALLTYSTGIEFGQHWVPGRFLSFLDMLANGSGIIAAWLLVNYLRKFED